MSSSAIVLKIVRHLMKEYGLMGHVACCIGQKTETRYIPWVRTRRVRRITSLTLFQTNRLSTGRSELSAGTRSRSRISVEKNLVW